MAQIPVFNGRQVMEPGAPVQVGSAESAAGNLWGNAIEGLGKAMVFLGDQAKKAKDQNDKYLAKSVADDAYLLMLKRKAEIDARGVGSDDRPDGFTAVEIFATNVDNDMETFLNEKLGDNSEIRTHVTQLIKEDRAKMAAMVLAGEVKKREEFLPIQRQAMENTAATKVRANSMKYGYEMNVLQFQNEQQALNAQLAQDESISGAQFSDFINKANKTLARESISGYIDKIHDGDFGAAKDARRMLVENFKQYFTSEEMSKEMDRIDDAYTGKIDRSHKYINWQRDNAEYAKDQAQDAAFREIMTRIQSAGSNETEMQSIENQIDGDLRLHDESFRAALRKSVRTGSLPGDEAVENKFHDMNLMQNKGMKEIDKFLKDQFAHGKLSLPKFNDLKSQLSALKDRTKISSEVNALIGDATRELQAMASITEDPLNPRYTESNVVKARVATELQSRMANIAKNRPVTSEDVMWHFNDITSKRLHTSRDAFNTVRGVPNSSMRTTEQVEQVKKDVAKKILQDRNAGKLTPEKMKEYKRQLDDLKKRDKAIQYNESFKVTPSTSKSRTRPFDE